MSPASPTDVSPTVSVVIPLYNKDRFIDRAIASVKAQQYPVSEILVVDDGSTDGAPERLLASPIPGLTVIRKKNGGPGSARNTGARAAKGTYISFLDADDEWAPTFLQTIVPQMFALGPSVRLGATAYRQEPSGRLSTQGFEHLSGVYETSASTPVHRIEELETLIHPQFSVMHRETMLALGGYVDQFRCVYGEDSYLLLKFILNTKVLFIPEPHGVYHRDASELFGNGFASAPPLLPFFTHTDGLLASCPPELAPILRSFVARQALSQARVYTSYGQRATALKLLSDFCRGDFSPAGTFSDAELKKAITFANVAPLFPVVRRLRHAVRSLRT